MRTLYFCPVVSFYLLSFFIPRLISATADWMSTILPHVVCPSANLECRSEMCCTRLAGNTGCKKSPSVHHRTTLSDYIFATKAHIDNWKKLVKQQYLPHMSLQYGELRPTSGWDCFVSLGHPAIFNGFRVLAALLHSQTAALNRGRHLYSAGGHHVGHWPTFLVSFTFCPQKT